MKQWVYPLTIVSCIIAVPLNWYAFGPGGAAVFLVLWVACFFLGRWVGEIERGER